MKDTVRMYIDKFDGEVIIEPDHPLAVAQREKDAQPKAARPARAPSATSTPSSTAAPSTEGETAAAVAELPKTKKRSRKRASG